MTQFVEWDKMNTEERSELITPYLESLKEKMIKAEGLSISTHYDWHYGRIKSEYKSTLVGEEITLDIRYY